jgi:2'-hydroxyisoflavone reductase
VDSSRRRFIQAALTGVAAAAGGTFGTIGAVAGASTAGAGQLRATTPLRILILGGTGYIGPHMVSEFLRRGHTVSLFNRGRTNEDLFPDLETLIGDRDVRSDGGLDALKGRHWDVVVDNSGYVPRHVADSARLLSSAVAHYVYVSTISVYESFAVANDENSPLGTMPDESVEEVTGATYGPMKALCEQRAQAEIGKDRLTILRPTYICGPGDRTDRFSYWPVRTLRGGDMLWPGAPDDPIQIIDVRDLANFVVDCVEEKIVGTYNTVTPVASYTIGELMHDCAAVTAADMQAVWVSSEFLAAHELADGQSIPIWASPTGDTAAVAKISGQRAREKGLQTRPPRETCRDILSWWKTLPAERRNALRAGLSADVEQKLLAEWDQKIIR